MNNSLYQNYYNYSFIDYIKKFNFSSERSIYGDVTPDYFYSKDAPNEIYKYNPNAKLIAILRDPISFLLSMHTQLINSNYEKETDFKKALALERKREKEIIKQNPVCPDIFFQYSTLINYKIYIENYYSVFKNNFKIIIYEDFKKDNFKYIDLIAKFLKIKPIIPDKPEIYNISRTVKKDLIYRLKFFYPIRYINNLIPIKLKKTIKNIFEYYVMDSNPKKNNQLVDTDLIYLKKTFKPKVKLLNDYLSKNSKIFLDKEIDLVEYWDY
jgi:hypothetical protein